MKIVCDACQAKYSISDDKVQGKVFKIRCKKCSNIIVVRGGGGAAAEAAAPAGEKDTRVYDYGHEGGDAAPAADDAVWHVVINQDQVGPLTAVEVEQKYAAGEIDAETYAWREGFADWLPLAQVDVFAALVAGGATAAVAPSGGGAAAVSSMFGGGDEAGTVRSDPGDLFASASSRSAAASSDDDGGDLFGSKPAKHAEPAASGDGGASKLRGERNENSVLFSLNNLAQLASNKPAPSASVSSTPSGHATGAAGGEGSGLIDIRSMASAYMGGSAGAASGAKPATASAGIGSIDDLPVFGGGGFSEPAVIVPVATRGGGNNKMMYALIGSVALLAVAAVVIVVVLLKGGDKKTETVAANTVASDKGGDSDDKDTKPDDKPAEPAKTEDKPTEAAATEDKPAEPAKTEDKPAEPAKSEDKPEKPTVAKTEKPHVERKPSTTTERKPTVVATKPAESKPSGGDSGGCDEVSCMLNEYAGSCCAKFKKGGSKPSAAKPSSGGNVPDALDRGMIQAGVDKVKARVLACGDRSSAKGQVKVSVKVSPGGSVSSVTVKASPDAKLGSCVQSAMSKATFAKTANGGSFAYPWNF